jgi:hypothetical protein
MALFSKNDPIATAVSAVEIAVKARARLDSQRADAEASLDAATVASNALANDGADDDTLGKAESRVTEADKLLSRRLLAVEAKDAEIKILESAREKAQEDQQVAETCIYNHKLKEELIKEGELFTACAARMRSICERAELIAPEASGFKQFSEVLVTQGPEAVALISKLIDNNTAAVSARQAPAKGKRLAAPVILPAVARPVRMTLFAVRPVKYVDPDSGKLIVAQKFSDVEMPPTFAKVALDHKVCVRITDPLRAQHNNSVAGHPDAALAFDLDAAMVEKASGPRLVEPIRQSNPHPQFVETIGQPGQARLS